MEVLKEERLYLYLNSVRMNIPDISMTHTISNGIKNTKKF